MQYQPHKTGAKRIDDAHVFMGPAFRLTSLRLIGTVRELEPSRRSLGEDKTITLLLMLPGSYLREVRFGEVVDRSGVSGGTLLNTYVPGSAIRSDSSSDQLTIERRRLVRWFLTVAMETQTVVSLKVTADEKGGSGATRLTSDEGFTVDVEFDSGVPLASRLRYRDVVSLPQAGGGTSSTSAEVVMELDDYKPVAGRLLPHHLMTSATGIVLEDIRITGVAINPKLTEQSFVGIRRGHIGASGQPSHEGAVNKSGPRPTAGLIAPLAKSHSVRVARLLRSLAASLGLRPLAPGHPADEGGALPLAGWFLWQFVVPNSRWGLPILEMFPAEIRHPVPAVMPLLIGQLCRVRRCDQILLKNLDKSLLD